MGSRDRNTGKRPPRPAKSAGKARTPAGLPDIAPEDEISAGEVQFAEGNDLGSGRRDLPEELQTDGPVMRKVTMVVPVLITSCQVSE